MRRRNSGEESESGIEHKLKSEDELSLRKSKIVGGRGGGRGRGRGGGRGENIYVPVYDHFFDETPKTRSSKPKTISRDAKALLLIIFAIAAALQFGCTADE